MCLTGAILWWPGKEPWLRGMTVRRHLPWRRLVRDLHAALGFWLVPLVLLRVPRPFQCARRNRRHCGCAPTGCRRCHGMGDSAAFWPSVGPRRRGSVGGLGSAPRGARRDRCHHVVASRADDLDPLMSALRNAAAGRPPRALRHFGPDGFQSRFPGSAAARPTWIAHRLALGYRDLASLHRTDRAGGLRCGKLSGDPQQP